MRALVTGATGFVGGYLVAALRAHGAQVLRCGGPHDANEAFALDIGDPARLRAALEAGRPDVVFHLAAQSFVPESLRAPLETLQVNAMGSAALAEAVRTSGADPPPRILFVSSAEVYGNREAAEYPLHETLDLRPANPYGASKAAAEAILLAYARSFGLDVVIARAFNHIGPGQSERFAVASFAAQIAGVAAGAAPQIYVGNLASARDFLDVRDVVGAYLALARGGESGEVYNVCSGKAVSVRDLLRELIAIAHVPVEVREEPSRRRSTDVPLVVGSSEKLRRATGWQPARPLVESLRDVYAAARRD